MRAVTRGALEDTNVGAEVGFYEISIIRIVTVVAKCRERCGEQLPEIGLMGCMATRAIIGGWDMAGLGKSGLHDGLVTRTAKLGSRLHQQALVVAHVRVVTRDTAGEGTLGPNCGMQSSAFVRGRHQVSVASGAQSLPPGPQPNPVRKRSSVTGIAISI